MTTIDPAAAAAADTIAQFEGPSSALDSMQRWLHSHPLASPTLVLVLASLYFSLFTERFFTATNLSTILAQVTIIGTLAVAQTLVVLTAGIDLSVGSITVLSSVVMGKLAFGWGYAPVLALLLGMVVGTACGLLNGGADHAPANSSVHRHARDVQRPVRPQPVVLRERDAAQPGPQGAGVDPAVVRPHLGADRAAFASRTARCSCSLLFVVAWYLLRRTAWGRHVYATGDDREAARLVGIRTDRVLMSVYAGSGLICGHRRVVVDQPHRHGVAEAAGERQPRLDHRRRDRRHEPVRWARQRVRFTARGPHRRRVRQWPVPGGRASRCGGRSPSACSSSSRSAIDQWIRRVAA